MENDNFKYPTTNEIEMSIKSFIENKGYKCTKIKEKDYPNQKVPDFRIESDTGALFFAEVKSPPKKAN